VIVNVHDDVDIQRIIKKAGWSVIVRAVANKLASTAKKIAIGAAIFSTGVAFGGGYIYFKSPRMVREEQV
jgi:uncharacterized protein involved in exopolysaccharide biosynthesis